MDRLCDFCDGTGMDPADEDDDCPECGGTGEVPGEEENE